MRHPLPWFLLSDEPRRCIHGTTIDCLGCRSSLLEYRLVAVEVVGLLSAFAVFGCPVVDLRKGVVRTESFVQATVYLINLLNIPIKNT